MVGLLYLLNMVVSAFGLNTERYGVKRENMGQKNSEYEHLSCSVHISVSK